MAGSEVTFRLQRLSEVSGDSCGLPGYVAVGNKLSETSVWYRHPMALQLQFRHWKWMRISLAVCGISNSLSYRYKSSLLQHAEIVFVDLHGIWCLSDMKLM